MNDAEYVAYNFLRNVDIFDQEFNERSHVKEAVSRYSNKLD